MAATDLVYLSVEDVLTLHETIVQAGEETEPGVRSRGDVEYAVTTVREGHFGAGPETLHEKAADLVRLLTANHPFVDGNKRTALVSTVGFYALNGYSFDYGDEIRTLLKRLATDESMVPTETLVDYLDSHTSEMSDDRRTRYHDFLDVASRSTSWRNDYTDEEGT